MKFKKIKTAVAVGLGLVTLSGCMGQMGVTGKVTKFNLEVVDNRYGREGMFVLLSPVYAIASLADLFIFNAIEFWTGTNPITNKSPAVVDAPADTIFRVNDDSDASLKTVPLSNNSEFQDIQMQRIDENTLQMNVTYNNGQHKSIIGERVGEYVVFSLNNEVITKVALSELEAYVAYNTI